MSYVRHLREATTELARHDTKVDVRDRWGPQKPLPSAEKGILRCHGRGEGPETAGTAREV